jgi:uncharacterized protein (TIGR00369 family)
MTSRHDHDHDVPTVAWQRDGCFGCGPANPHGLHLHFTLAPAGKSYVCEFMLDENFVGPPGHVHGGIIATILDEAMGKANKLRGKVALTRQMQVDYLRPVPLRQPLIAEGRVLRVRGRALYNAGELRDASGKVLARSRGKFLSINPETMFPRELEEERRKRS